ncbi:MAG TPA: lysophospholipid acyltransferase family protein [Pirellulales bacterium]|jgi:1-acyl-sn-glycerol-3-phosphate acyltransferase|nr:lysophospholipid acyltransferase family protein [Pirellulales bacterium]
MATRSLAKRIWYDYLRMMSRLVAAGLFQLRCNGRERVPAHGPVLVVSNHQSHFDPVLIASVCNRRLNFLARQTLFRFAPFGWLIKSLDAIPLDRDGLGMAGLKETLRRLKRGEMVLVFPEGTRTRDGNVGPLKPGFCALVHRTEAAVVPVAIDGAFDAWPRWHRWPRRACIRMEFGEPLTAEEAKGLADGALMAEVDRRLRVCHAAARAGRLHALNRDAAMHPA